MDNQKVSLVIDLSGLRCDWWPGCQHPRYKMTWCVCHQKAYLENKIEALKQEINVLPMLCELQPYWTQEEYKKW